MPEIARVYRQSLSPAKFVGICYTEADTVNGTYSHKWGEWFQQNLFAPLEAARGGWSPCGADGEAYYGLCRCKEGEPFQYWIGEFLPPDAPIPQGYDSITPEVCEIAVCWIRGKEPEIYFHSCMERLAQEGCAWTPDKNGVLWCFERYVNPRFTQPDGNGDVILDMCYAV